MNEIKTAADLWEKLVKEKAIDPEGYDAEIAQDIAFQLGCNPKDIILNLNSNKWDAKKLIGILAVKIKEFSSLLRDLLVMYREINALNSTGNNLRIRYEFKDGEVIDDFFEPFAERVEEVLKSIEVVNKINLYKYEATPFEERWNIWRNIYSKSGKSVNDYAAENTPEISKRLLGFDFDKDRFNATYEKFIFSNSLTNNVALSSLIYEANNFFIGYVSMVSVYGRSHEDILKNMREALVKGGFFFDFTDFWFYYHAIRLQAFLDLINNSEISNENDSIENVSKWLKLFYDSVEYEVEDVVEKITDILSLPYWGKRYEMYSAWVTTQFFNAYKNNTIEFNLGDDGNTLSFPFKEHRIADFIFDDDRFSLYCEKKSDLKVESKSGGKTKHIQPDYSIVNSKDEVVAAIEVKQYKRAANSKHSKTVYDYVMSLSESSVCLVGYRKLGGNLDRELQSIEDKKRFSSFENLNPENPCVQKEFSEYLANIISSTKPKAEKITLTWDGRIKDLDLYLVNKTTKEECCFSNLDTGFARFLGHSIDGLPQDIRVFNLSSGDYLLKVKVYSSELLNRFSDTGARVEIIYDDGSNKIFAPDLKLLDREWLVGSFHYCNEFSCGENTLMIESGALNID